MTGADPFHIYSWLMGGLMIGLRVTGVMVFAPFFSSSAIPIRIKACLTIALTVVLYPLAPQVVTSGSTLATARIAGEEFTVGLLLGTVLQFVVDAMQMAGQMLGTQLGFSLVNILDPQTQVDTPVMSIFHEMIAILFFLRMNVHHWIIRGLAHSFQYLPVGSVGTHVGSAKMLLESASGILLVGLQIATPVLAVTILVDVALGFLGKASPNLPVLFLGLSIKNLLGLFVMIVTLGFWPDVLDRQFHKAFDLGQHLLYLVR